MKPIFEYNDTLNNPYEAFLFNNFNDLLAHFAKNIAT